MVSDSEWKMKIQQTMDWKKISRDWGQGGAQTLMIDLNCEIKQKKKESMLRLLFLGINS